MILPEMLRAQERSASGDSMPPSWDVRFQQTVVIQGHPEFSALYSGANSLQTAAETKTSITSTLFFGVRLWSGSEVYINPEMSGGEGMSGATGVAGFPNGETFRIGNPKPTPFLARAYVAQTFACGSVMQYLSPDVNQFGGSVPVERLTIVIGKFGLADFFDDNSYSHDPRTQFLNWALMNNGAWDYAADTRGYTWGLLSVYHAADWTVRGAGTLEPKYANGLEMDTRVTKAFSLNVELERRYQWNKRDGTIRFLLFRNQADMGNYDAAIGDTSVPKDIVLTRHVGRMKYGVGINVEQQIADHAGLFGRLGWNDGINETWAYTEIDRTLSLGGELKGNSWNRQNDQLGAALVLNALSQGHLRYLGDGGYGFLLGDGKLRYGPELVFETYYSALLKPWMTLSVDYQFVTNPGYNRDRGPVHVFAARIHTEL